LVKIRLTRKGAKNSPFYSVVVADGTMPRDGRFIETLGYYDPKKKPQIVELNEDRAVHWLSKGADPSPTVKSLLRQKGILAKLAGHEKAPEETTEA
jgi:small subunit ribosomal protein S16